MRYRVATGLIAVLAVPAALLAQPNTTPAAPVYVYPTPLYRMSDVTKTLNLTPEQVTKLNKVTDATQLRYRDDYVKIGSLNEAERFARAHELNAKYNADWNAGAREVLDDTQRARYQQLNYQYGGFATLYDPEVQKRLNITADQRRDLRAQWDWSNQQFAEINRAGVNDATKAAQMYRDYATARQERMNKFLTADQQKAWNQIVGTGYSFQPTFSPRR